MGGASSSVPGTVRTELLAGAVPFCKTSLYITFLIIMSSCKGTFSNFCV